MEKLFAWAVWMVAAAAWAQSSPPAVISSKTAPTQPIPFNHKVHAAAGLTCLGCHAIAAPGDLAGLPAATFCMGCHETVKKDSPAIHYKQARIECAVCHGPVAERSVIAQEKSTAMVDCMKCHDQYKAPNGCDLCHDAQ